MSLEENDTVKTIGDDGERVWLYVRRVVGRFVLLRYIVSWTLFLILFLAPWIDINGHPAIFLDLPQRRFYVFGLTFFATNAYYLLFVAGLIIFGIFLSSSTLGRAWCGWVCPQSVFMESFVRLIEEFIEGKPAQRKRLDREAWHIKKIIKKVSKWVVFIILAGMISTTTVAYFIGRQSVLESQFDPWSHPVATGIFIFLTALLSFDFLWFREQVCLIVCPYGRFQSVLMDKHSVSVWYDVQRGEPRGKTKIKESHQPLGDCVDCGLCIQVCPTGIDIRKGSQLECIQCAACVDACDSIMQQLNRATGLVRYSTEAELKGEKTRYFRPRVLAYLLAFLGVLSALILTISLATSLDIRVTRMVDAPYEVLEHGQIKNGGQIRVSNHLNEPIMISVKLAAKDQDLSLVMPIQSLELKPASVNHLIFFLIDSSLEKLNQARREVTFVLLDEKQKELGKAQFTFLAPEVRVSTKQ